MSWSGFVKFLLGFFIALALLFAAGVGTTRYLMAKLAAPPPKPVFPNDSPTPQASASAATEVAASPAASPSPSPSPSPAGLYQAIVTQPIGLIIRQEPSAEAGEIGGVEYNQELTILEESADGLWQRVRLGDGVEGWVKSGNVERVN